MAFLKKLRAAKKACPVGEKPAFVKTHLRNMIIIPEMIGGVIALYNGKDWNEFEVRVRSARFFFLLVCSLLLFPFSPK